MPNLPARKKAGYAAMRGQFFGILEYCLGPILAILTIKRACEDISRAREGGAMTAT